MEDDKIRQLAENLKKNNLAASMAEAIEKAKSILSVNSAKVPRETKDNPEIEDEDKSLNELMREINVEPEDVEFEEREKLDHLRSKLFKIKQDINKDEKKPEYVSDVNREIKKIREDYKELMELREDESQEGLEEFSEEKIKGNQPDYQAGQEGIREKLFKKQIKDETSEELVEDDSGDKALEEELEDDPDDEPSEENLEEELKEDFQEKKK
jgi:hypothetical protein